MKQFSPSGQLQTIAIGKQYSKVPFMNVVNGFSKGMVSIYTTVAPSEAVLANAILQFCINVCSVYFNIPSSKQHQGETKTTM